MAVAVVGAVVAVIGAISGFLGAKGQANIENAKNHATRITNKANNEFKVASTALQNYIRSEQNNRLLKLAGENYNALGQNMVRTYDDAMRGSAAKRIQAAESLGSMAAAAAAVGVGGSTTEMLNSTYRRAVNIQANYDREKLDYAVNDMAVSRSNQISNAVAQMDQGTSFAQTQGMYLADTKVSPLGFAMQGIANAMPYIDTWMQNRAAKAQVQTTQAAPNTNSITLL